MDGRLRLRGDLQLGLLGCKVRLDGDEDGISIPSALPSKCYNHLFGT